MIIISKILTSKFFIYPCIIVGVFLLGYFYRGTREEIHDAQVITKEVIKYVENENKIRKKYQKIDIKDKKTKEDILSGRISEHYNPNSN